MRRSLILSYSSQAWDSDSLLNVDEALARIRNQPLAWHPLSNNLRRCHLRHFRYGVIYRIRGEQAEILAIAHDSRRPGYWRNRR